MSTNVASSVSIIVVEGRRSGDIWLAKGYAIDGEDKFSRARFEVSNAQAFGSPK